MNRKVEGREDGRMAGRGAGREVGKKGKEDKEKEKGERDRETKNNVKKRISFDHGNTHMKHNRLPFEAATCLKPPVQKKIQEIIIKQTRKKQINKLPKYKNSSQPIIIKGESLLTERSRGSGKGKE